MFQDMEISRVLAQVFHSEAKTLLEERADWKTCTIHSWNLVEKIMDLLYIVSYCFCFH